MSSRNQVDAQPKSGHLPSERGGVSRGGRFGLGFSGTIWGSCGQSERHEQDGERKNLWMLSGGLAGSKMTGRRIRLRHLNAHACTLGPHLPLGVAGGH
jgi:hypothetical protein